jgi:hypothetical protein
MRIERMKLQLFLKFCFLFLVFVASQISFAQDQNERKSILLKEIVLKKDFKNLYATQLRRLRRVYPLALEAAKMIQQMDEEISMEESNLKKKKITKKYHQQIKSEYLYVIKDLYIEEGKLLMKLIHRETGMTVAEIIKKYKNRFRSEIYDQLGKLWDQDLDAKYDPNGDDIITEIVIRDILSKEVNVDLTPRHLKKEEYKQEMKEYRMNKRAAKKVMRQKRRAASEVVNEEE